MNETVVTVQGYVGTQPQERTVLDTVATSFRVGSTPRRFSKEQNAWVDGETSWFTVNAWRALARHCAGSLRVGEPVIVHGRMRASSYEDGAGNKQTTMVIEAISVGHDLKWGTSAYLKAQAPGTPTEDPGLAAFNAQLATEDAPRLTSDGRVVDEPAGEGPAGQEPLGEERTSDEDRSAA